MVRVSSPAKLRPWSELNAKMVMGVVPGLVRNQLLPLQAGMFGNNDVCMIPLRLQAHVNSPTRGGSRRSEAQASLIHWFPRVTSIVQEGPNLNHKCLFLVLFKAQLREPFLEIWIFFFFISLYFFIFFIFLPFFHLFSLKLGHHGALEDKSSCSLCVPLCRRGI